VTNPQQPVAPVPQPVLSPPTGTAIFLVVRVNPGGERAVRGLLPDLAGLQRSVGARVPAGALTCVAGIGSAVWDRLFSGPRPAGLHPFPELAGSKYIAIATPGDLFFHIKAMSMNLCFEMTAQIMDRLSGAVTVEDEVHGFRYFEERDLLGFVGGTENPGGQAAAAAVLVGPEDPRFTGGSYVIAQKYLHDMRAWNALPVEEQEKVLGRTKLSNIALPAGARSANSHVALTAAAGPGRAQRQILRDKMPFGSAGHPPPYRTGRARRRPDQKRSGGDHPASRVTAGGGGNGPGRPGPVYRRSRCAASSGIAAIFSSVRSSQRIPAAARGPCNGRQSMMRSGVTIRSTGTS
jgi:putative iron-dependent peroxidase